MILPLTNLLAGLFLAVPILKKWFGKQHIENAEGALNKFRTPLGVIILLLGIVGLIKRMSLFGIMYEWSWHYGSTFPQSIIAILMGLFLCADLFSKWPALHSRIVGMKKYGAWLGMLGILVAVSSWF